MEDKKILLDNINKIHTTELGVDRIKRNLKIDIVDVVEYCKNKVLDENCHTPTKRVPQVGDRAPTPTLLNKC